MNSIFNIFLNKVIYPHQKMTITIINVNYNLIKTEKATVKVSNMSHDWTNRQNTQSDLCLGGYQQ